jgi:hypothetical protein
LTGVFPNSTDSSSIPGGHLRLVRCTAKGGCGLVQLDQSFDPNSMYGENYGYRSGLNPSMVQHLRNRVDKIIGQVALVQGDVVLDIGSNDGTALGFYDNSVTRIGVDPTAFKFADHYPEGVISVPDFFSTNAVRKVLGGKTAKVITAFSMIYDLEDPVAFVAEVSATLDPAGIFVFEQSYLPVMLEHVAFDTICHEHLEYYGLRQIDWLLDTAELEVVDVELNDVNGGSFAVTAAHRGRRHPTVAVEQLRNDEARLWNAPDETFKNFAMKSREAATQLKAFVLACGERGERLAALGASTKGNVLLQFAGLGPESIAMIGDVNPDKYGRFTPGTWIPIVPEQEVLNGGYDHLLILPWHFREFFLRTARFNKHRLVFPLPHLEVVEATEKRG